MSEGKNVPAIRHTDARLGRLVWLHRRANRHHGSGSASRTAVLLVATLPLVGILLVPLLAGAIAATGVIAYDHIAAGLPDLAALTRSSLPQTTRFYDRTGQHVLATLYTQDRDYVSYDQIPATVITATVPANVRHLARRAIRHPAVTELANAGLVFLPGRYLPLGWAATWATRPARHRRS